MNGGGRRERGGGGRLTLKVSLQLIHSDFLGSMAMSWHTMRQLQLRWAATISNGPQWSGSIHRALSSEDSLVWWSERVPCLREAMEDFGMSLCLNPSSVLISNWPHLQYESKFGGEMLDSVSSLLPLGREQCSLTVPSVLLGGAAAVAHPSKEYHRLAQVFNPTSSVQCELSALIDVSSLSTSTKQ